MSCKSGCSTCATRGVWHHAQGQPPTVTSFNPFLHHLLDPLCYVLCQVAELQDEVVRLRAAAEANQRSTREEVRHWITGSGAVKVRALRSRGLGVLDVHIWQGCPLWGSGIQGTEATSRISSSTNPAGSIALHLN